MVKLPIVLPVLINTCSHNATITIEIYNNSKHNALLLSLIFNDTERF